MKAYNNIYKVMVAAAMLAMASCADNVLVPTDDVQETATKDGVQAIRLIDEQGNLAYSLSSDYGEYYLDILANGPWKINCSGDYIKPLVTTGSGNARVPVQIGSQWAGVRRGIISVESTSENVESQVKTRATTTSTSSSVEEITFKQASLDTTMMDFDDMYSSNIGVGYGYLYRGENKSMNLTFPIFNLPNLNRNTELTTAVDFHIDEDVITAKSENDLNDQLAVKGGVKLSIAKKLNIDVEAAYSSNSKESTKKTYINSTHYARGYVAQLEWLNLIGDSKRKASDIYSSAWLYVKENFLNELDAATTAAQKQQLVADFYKQVGTHFVTRAGLGAQLDYTADISNTSLTDEVTVKAVLKVKYKKEVVDSTKNSQKVSVPEEVNWDTPDDPEAEEWEAEMDSLDKALPKIEDTDNSELNKPVHVGRKASSSSNTDSSGKSTEFNFDAEAEYQNKLTAASENMSAKLKVQGGDGRYVTLLPTGTSISSWMYNAWCLSLRPSNSTLVDMQLVEIYRLFSETDDREKAARELLRAYLEE